MPAQSGSADCADLLRREPGSHLRSAIPQEIIACHPAAKLLPPATWPRTLGFSALTQLGPGVSVQNSPRNVMRGGDRSADQDPLLLKGMSES